MCWEGEEDFSSIHKSSLFHFTAMKCIVGNDFLLCVLWGPFSTITFMETFLRRKSLENVMGFCVQSLSQIPMDGTNLLIPFSIKDPKKKLHENSYVIFLWNFPKSHVRKRACVPKHPSIYQQTSTSKLWQDRVMVVVEFLDKTQNTLYRLEVRSLQWP